MKKQFKKFKLNFTLVCSVPFLLNLNGCNHQAPLSFNCNYTFFDCAGSKVESTYKNHRARIVRFSDSNNLPAPYDKEFYALDLFPDGNTSLPSWRKVVLPCGDLPIELREAGIFVSVSGEQLDCLRLSAINSQIRFAGNNVFKVTKIEKIEQ